MAYALTEKAETTWYLSISKYSTATCCSNVGYLNPAWLSVKFEGA